MQNNETNNATNEADDGPAVDLEEQAVNGQVQHRVTASTAVVEEQDQSKVFKI